ncbi:MAG: cytochrome c biogenesis protein CcsA [Methanomassiliicoccus sp.]|nr:cytochrome c biogenesis protein CcsA [Methanomassiliicoccus sp.]
MSIGDVLLVLAALSALVACTAGALRLRRDDARLDAVSRYASLLAFASITASLLLLCYLFLTSDMSYEYVWSHSHTALDPFYKLVGVWAGGEGGLVLWTWFMAAFLAAEVVLERKRALNARFSSAFRVSAGSIVLLFSLILIAAGLFSPTGELELMLRPDGAGMNMALQTIEMALHPPLVFAAYAACLIVFSAALGRFLVDEREWMAIALPWARIAGLLLFLGIAVGAVWAYYELGWGGFWVWDPVETASLLPTAAIIAFLHSYRSKAARDGYLLPFLGMLSFVLVLLSSFITRTGGLWGSSVHTYGSSVNGSIEARFIAVLTGDMSIMGLFTVIMVLFALSLYLAYRSASRLGDEGRVENSVLMPVALLLMYVALLLLLLIKNTGLDQGQNFIEFTEKTTLLSFAMMTALVFGLLDGRIRRRRALMASGTVAAVATASAVATLLAGFPWLVGLVLPPAAAIIAISAWRIASDRGGKMKRLARSGGHLVHVGVALVLLCFIISSTLQASLPDGAEPMSIGDEITLGDRTIALSDLTIRPWTSSTGEPGEVRTATFIISSGGSARTVTVSNNYQNTSSGAVLVHASTAILNGLAEDVYLSYEWMNNGTAAVQARVIPMVSGVWAGLAIASAGMAIALFGRGRETDLVPNG